MNHVYRLVWSKTRNGLIAVPEMAGGAAKGRGSRRRKSGARSFIAPLAGTLGLLGALPPLAAALPTGGQVAVGQASISTNGRALTVKQSSAKAVLNWQSFGIGNNETVTFQQPSTSSVALNRVLGTDASTIAGTLTANGQVFLVNPNGVYFAPGAQVDVGGIVASTLGISTADFLSGHYSFSGLSTAAVGNAGVIAAKTGGYVAFIGRDVSNTGSLAAPGGKVALGAGAQVDLTLEGNSLLGFGVSADALKAEVRNGGVIQADGGAVVLTAKARNALMDTVVNNTGVIRAQTAVQQNGVIRLLGGDSGQVKVAGTLDASAPRGGNGGKIETSGAHVTIDKTATITTRATQGTDGTWLIDPTDFTIAANGGDMTGVALTTALANGSVTIQTTASGASCTGATCASGTSGNGDISVNDTVRWSKNTLTLSANRNITINSEMFGSGTAGLALAYGQGASDGKIGGTVADYFVNAPVDLGAGGSFRTTLGSNGTPVDYTIIDSLGNAGSMTGVDLQGINGNPNGNYVLGASIDASATSGWNGGKGFAPLGYFSGVSVNSNGSLNTTAFTGIFDGLGHTVSGLTINRPASDSVGFFGTAGSNDAGQLALAEVRNIGLIGGSVTGRTDVGALAGAAFANISNAYATTPVIGKHAVGGLIGTSSNSTVTNAHATGTVTSPVTGGSIGGLVGSAEKSIISNVYATGDVTGGIEVGGLVGTIGDYTTIQNGYATGQVSGTLDVGGLVADMNGINSTAKIHNVYALGSVTGTNWVGGLVGHNHFGTIDNAYWNLANTPVSVGEDDGVNGGWGGPLGSLLTPLRFTPVTNLIGLSTSEMRTASSFTGFTFTTTPGAPGWVLVDQNGTLNNTSGALGATLPMLADEYSQRITNTHQLQLMAMAPAAHYHLAQSVDASLAGGTGRINDVWIGSSFIPIGTQTTPFTGSFDGGSNSVANLTINLPHQNDVGLFGVVGTGATIRNAHLTNPVVVGGSNTGALVGKNGGTVQFSYEVGSVTGNTNAGGLIGQNAGKVSNAYAAGGVTGTKAVGGLVGSNSSGTISDTYAINTVTSTKQGGALVGLIGTGTVADSFYDTGVNSGLPGASDKADSAGVVYGIAKTAMQTQQNFTSATQANGNTNPAWDFSGVWAVASSSYPLLLAVPAGYTPGASSGTNSGSSRSSGSGGSGSNGSGTNGNGGSGGSSGNGSAGSGGSGSGSGGSGGTGNSGTGGSGGTSSSSGNGSAGTGGSGSGSGGTGGTGNSGTGGSGGTSGSSGSGSAGTGGSGSGSGGTGGSSGTGGVAGGGASGSGGGAAGAPHYSPALKRALEAQKQAVQTYHPPPPPPAGTFGTALVAQTAGGVNGVWGSNGQPVLSLDDVLNGPQLIQQPGTLRHGDYGPTIERAIPANAGSSPVAKPNFFQSFLNGFKEVISRIATVASSVGNALKGTGQAIVQNTENAAAALGQFGAGALNNFGNLMPVRVGDHVISTGTLKNVLAALHGTDGATIQNIAVAVASVGGGELSMSDLAELYRRSGQRVPAPIARAIAADNGKSGSVSASAAVRLFALSDQNRPATPDDIASIAAANGGKLTFAQAGGFINASGGRLELSPVIGDYVIAAGGGNVIAAGGGNVIAAGGGNVIAAGGGNVIAAGGGNFLTLGGMASVIAAGGGNFGPKKIARLMSGVRAGVIAAGGGNVIAAGGGNLGYVAAHVIAAGGGNVIAPGGGNLMAPGAGMLEANLIQKEAASFFASGAAQVIAAGGGNVIAAGGGNVIAAGGGNVIAAGGGNVIAAGGGN